MFLLFYFCPPWLHKWKLIFITFISELSVQFSHSVASDSLWPHGLQHRLPCPSPTPRACSNSCPSSQWCHPTISSSVVPFSSCLQSFPASGSFLRSQFFASGGQNIRASASASVLPMNQDTHYCTSCSILERSQITKLLSYKYYEKSFHHSLCTLLLVSKDQKCLSWSYYLTVLKMKLYQNDLAFYNWSGKSVWKSLLKIFG